MSKDKPVLSIIIPALNEAENLAKLLPYLRRELPGAEVIVADAQSQDESEAVAEKAGATFIRCRKMCRAVQMNTGAKEAKADLLYFLHADAFPPQGFYQKIKAALKEGYSLGCFRFQFDSSSKILALNAYFTRFDRLMCRGGDQSLFIKKKVFEDLQGFRSDYRIMEDYEFIIRARKKYPFKIIQDDVLVSARKYKENSYLRVNFANFIVFTLFRWGAKQTTMLKAYRLLLKHPKAESLEAQS
ncbi:MAG: TIGR04283 family arsenosugar biosynthesis glycosyltransferase [Vicingaceae bacterium]